MKKHTPEPWVASKVMNFSGTLVSFINSETTTIFQTRQSDDEASIEEVQANADIAAAAPELLEALNEAKLLIRLWHGIHEDIPTERKSWQLYSNSPEMKLINNAIQKATP